MKIKVKRGKRTLKLKLTPLESEPNLWKIEEEDEAEKLERGGGRIYGLVMTYVDDIMITGEEDVVSEVTKIFQEAWTTSTPEKIGEEAVRFLGMEVRREVVDGKTQWTLSQEAFVEDLLQRVDPDRSLKKIPITRDQSMMEKDDPKPEQAQVRDCQKIVGELLWILTRTRPDVMFPVARMGASVTRSTKKIKEAAHQLYGYLRGTMDEGLVYVDDEEDEFVVQAFSDASYAPNEEESHGSFIIMVNGAAVFWRSGRQHLVSLSTAESELTELVESMNAGESIATILDELCPHVKRVAHTPTHKLHWRF